MTMKILNLERSQRRVGLPGRCPPVLASPSEGTHWGKQTVRKAAMKRPTKEKAIEYLNAAISTVEEKLKRYEGMADSHGPGFKGGTLQKWRKLLETKDYLELLKRDLDEHS